VGVPVRNDSYEVTVLNARELKRVYMGNYYWYPNPGYIFVELIVRVSNLSKFDAHVRWENVYIAEEGGESWYPWWGGYQAVETDKEVDGSSVGVDEIVDGSVTINFAKDAVLRLIWIVAKGEKTTILFGFDDSPNIEIILE